MTLEDELGITSLKDMSTDDLRTMLRKIRHNRTTEDTLAQRKVKRAAKSDVAKLLEKLSPDELEKLKALMA